MVIHDFYILIIDSNGVFISFALGFQKHCKDLSPSESFERDLPPMYLTL